MQAEIKEMQKNKVKSALHITLPIFLDQITLFPHFFLLVDTHREIYPHKLLFNLFSQFESQINFFYLFVLAGFGPCMPAKGK